MSSALADLIDRLLPASMLGGHGGTSGSARFVMGLSAAAAIATLCFAPFHFFTRQAPDAAIADLIITAAFALNAVLLRLTGRATVTGLILMVVSVSALVTFALILDDSSMYILAWAAFLPLCGVALESVWVGVVATLISLGAAAWLLARTPLPEVRSIWAPELLLPMFVVMWLVVTLLRTVLRRGQREAEDAVTALQIRHDELIRGRAILAELAREKDELVSVIGNELRQPLSGVMGMTPLFERDQVDAETWALVETVRRDADEINATLASLASLERALSAMGQAARLAADFDLREDLTAALTTSECALDVASHLPQVVLGDGPRLAEVVRRIAEALAARKGVRNITVRLRRIDVHGVLIEFLETRGGREFPLHIQDLARDRRLEVSLWARLVATMRGTMSTRPTAALRFEVPLPAAELPVLGARRAE